MKALGARFLPVSHNRKLARVDMVPLGAHEEARTYSGHNFNHRPVARAPFCSATRASIQATCPNSCVFKRAGDGTPHGCYADAGFTRIAGKQMDEEARGLSAFEVILEEAIALDQAFPRGVPQDGARGGRDLRLHVDGDVPSPGAAELLAVAARNWKQRGGGSVWTYTHAWEAVPRDAFGPISVLASVETPEQIVRARARGYQPALVVESFPAGKRPFEVGGVRFIPCPAETLGKTCIECRLCLDADLAGMNAGIAFAIHGWDAKAAKAALVPLKVRRAAA